MKTYIALLKGINVGGHKKVPMVELRELLTEKGFKNVRTYIQSGNVIFQSSEESVTILEKTIHISLNESFGFEVLVIVKTRGQLQQVFDNSPFSEEIKKSSYFTLLHKKPSNDLVKIASEKEYDGEEYYIIKDCIYFYCAKGYGQAKFNMNFFEKKLNTFGTSRNYNTMLKLLSLSEN